MEISLGEMDFQQAVSNVNKYFKLTGRQKIVFDFNDDADFFKECLLLFYLYILGNIDHLMFDEKGCALLLIIIQKLKILDNRYETTKMLDDTEEQIFGPYGLRAALYSFFTIRSEYSNWKGDSYMFYKIRDALFQILKIILYGKERFISQSCPAYYLKKLQKQSFLKIKPLIENLPQERFFHMEKTIRLEHERWLEMVANFYFIEYQIVREDTNSLLERTRNDIKDYSIILHSNESNASKELAYNVGFITDNLNFVYEKILTKPIPRSRFGYEQQQIIDLCTLLMKDMITFSQNDTIQFFRNKPDRHFSARVPTKYLAALRNVKTHTMWDSKIESLPDETRQVLSILLNIIDILILPSNFILMASLSKENKEFLSAYSTEYIFDHDCRRMLDNIRELMEQLIIYDEENVSAILPTLRVFRMAFFNTASLFCHQLENIFFFTSSTRKSIKEFIEIDLQYLLEQREKFKDEFFMKNRTSKDTRRLGLLLGRPF